MKKNISVYFGKKSFLANVKFSFSVFKPNLMKAKETADSKI